MSVLYLVSLFVLDTHALDVSGALGTVYPKEKPYAQFTEEEGEGLAVAVLGYAAALGLAVRYEERILESKMGTLEEQVRFRRALEDAAEEQEISKGGKEWVMENEEKRRSLAAKLRGAEGPEKRQLRKELQKLEGELAESEKFRYIRQRMGTLSSSEIQEDLEYYLKRDKVARRWRVLGVGSAWYVTIDLALRGFANLMDRDATVTPLPSLAGILIKQVDEDLGSPRIKFSFGEAE